LFQILLPWQGESIGVKFGWQLRRPNPKNPMDAKISQISLTEAELLGILSQISLLWQGSVGPKYKWHC